MTNPTNPTPDLTKYLADAERYAERAMDEVGSHYQPKLIKRIRARIRSINAGSYTKAKANGKCVCCGRDLPPMTGRGRRPLTCVRGTTPCWHLNRALGYVSKYRHASPTRTRDGLNNIYFSILDSAEWAA
jgi:hypothetical protein